MGESLLVSSNYMNDLNDYWPHCHLPRIRASSRAATQGSKHTAICIASRPVLAKPRHPMQRQLLWPISTGTMQDALLGP